VLDVPSISQKLVECFGRTGPLGDDVRRAILCLPCSLITRGAGAYFVREADESKTCGLLVSGLAYRHKVTAFGARQILSVIVPGDMIDFQHLFLNLADHNVQALGDICVAVVPRAALRDLANSIPSIATAIATQLSIDASIYCEWMLNVGRRNAQTRVGHLLCELATRLGTDVPASGHCFELVMTQEKIGDAVGLTSVHVNRVMRSLEKDGLLTRRQRFVTLPRWDELRRASDFNDRYLHQDRMSSAHAGRFEDAAR
jgi:CRP-like cAMP-binding protein